MFSQKLSEIFMAQSVIVNMQNTLTESATLVRPITVLLIALVVFVLPVTAQESIVPFEEVLKRQVEIRAELKGVHPRLFFSKSDIARFRQEAKNGKRGLWQDTLDEIQTLRRDAPDPNDPDLYKSGLDKRKEGSISQYSLAFQITQTSFAYAIEQDVKYLSAAKKWTLASCEMPIWGYTYNKPNVDLPPAHLLYAVAFSYDLLFDKYTAAEREIIRNKLVKQARLMYEYFKYKPGKRYTYSQNHTWIPMAGLAVAAYALIDEVEEASEWARLSRAVFDRTMTTMGTDGFFYESFHYFGFAFRWTVRYFDVHKRITGEDLYVPMRSKLAGMKYYAMHSILPDGENVFDFADTGDGSLNRNGTSKRESLHAEYDLIYRLAAVYGDTEAQAVGDFIRNETKLETREPMWAFINRDADLKPASLDRIPLQYHFEDNDTVFWRSGWTKDATAFAFRCSPPEGHHAAKLASKIPDWRQNSGHAHPDANSFIIWANGKYLTGDTGYLGIKQTDDHNTILVNGRGQEKDGIYEMFKDVPNERLDQIRIAEYWANAEYFYARGEAASGYYADLGLRKFDRHFLYVTPGYFIVWDELETKAPATFTFMLNADRDIKLSEGRADLINGNAALGVRRALPREILTKVVPQTVQARGLPGSVDKGDSEQRGLQLRSTSEKATNRFEFLHLLYPYELRGKSAVPTIEPLSNGEKGVTVIWANGDIDTIHLARTSTKVGTFDRMIVRADAAKVVKKTIAQRAGTVWIDGKKRQ